MITSAEEFVKLRESENPEEYFRASHESSKREVWLEVIEKYSEMREWVAHNKTVKGEILEMLSQDPDERVRWKIARRRAAGEQLLSQLALDAKENVRLAVLRNAKVTETVVRILTQDKSRYVRNEAKEKLAQMENSRRI